MIFKVFPAESAANGDNYILVSGEWPSNYPDSTIVWTLDGFQNRNLCSDTKTGILNNLVSQVRMSGCRMMMDTGCRIVRGAANLSSS